MKIGYLDGGGNLLNQKITDLPYVSQLGNQLLLGSIQGVAVSIELQQGCQLDGLLDLHYRVQNIIMSLKLINVYIIRRTRMEDKVQIVNESNLSKTSSYMLDLAEVKGNSLEQQILMLFNSKYTGNDLKKAIQTADYIVDNLNSVFKDLELNRIYKIIKRVSRSFSNICSHLIQALEKYKISSSLATSQPEQKKEPDIAKKTEIQNLAEQQIKLKINRMRGVCLYNQNYKRSIDSESANQEGQASKKKKAEQEIEQQVDEKQFKRRLFNKMKKQLKQVEQDLYCPSPDQMTTFIIFERKFIQSFNHLSHAQSLEVIADYLQNSKMSAVQVLNEEEDMNEKIAAFKTEIQLLIKQAKNRTHERNQTISQKFQNILSQFLMKRKELFIAIQKKLNIYRKMVEDKQEQRVSIGVETNVKQLGTLKGFEKKVVELQQKYKTKDEEKTKAYRTMLEKSDQELSTLHAEITKYKIANKNLSDDFVEAKKQNAKILQKLYEKKNTAKSPNQNKIQKSTDKKSESKLEWYESDQADDKNAAISIRDKRSSVRQSSLPKRAKQQQNGDDQNSSPFKAKQKKVVSIKEIEHDSRTNTMINYQDKQSGSGERSNFELFEAEKDVIGLKNGEFKRKRSRNQISKTIKSTSFFEEDRRKQKSHFLGACTQKSFKNQMYENYNEPGEDWQKRGRSVKFISKTLQKIQSSKKSISKQSDPILRQRTLNTQINQIDKNKQEFDKNEQYLQVPNEDTVKNQPRSVSQKREDLKNKQNKPNNRLTEKNYENNKTSKVQRFGKASNNHSYVRKHHQKNKTELEFSQAYCLSFDNGNVVQFFHKQPIQVDCHDKSSYWNERIRTIERSRQFMRAPMVQQQQKILYARKKFSFDTEKFSNLKLYKHQSNSFHLDGEQKTKHDLNHSDSVLRVKGLFKQRNEDSKAIKKSAWEEEQAILRKKLAKHFEVMEWLSRKKEPLTFKFNEESIHDNTIFHERIKLKQNQKLKRIKKKREQFENLYRKKKTGIDEQVANQSKLPGINIKSFF